MKKITLLLFLSIIFSVNCVLAGRTVIVSPEIRIIERKHEIPSLQMEMIQHFLNRPKIVTPDEIEDMGYIVANAENSLFVTQGSKIYVRNLYDAEKGKKYAIMRLGQAYRNPAEDEEEVLAYEGVYLGESTVEQLGEPTVLNVTSAVREIGTGARLMAVEESGFPKDFYLHSPENLDEAYIVALLDGTLSIGKYQIVVINKGAYDGIEKGHVLAIEKATRLIKDKITDEEVMLPQQQVGKILVFKAFEQVSYALVTKADKPINQFDIITVP
ncbi:hypothetical protein QUF74_12630 [Candidatus Halobeggiatoa sp. HSG11]|nr:hypothetical protein [Candidatus Halobeggiatoa sp. HSG11]